MDVFDVVVVGAGPCGATAAYFLAKGMNQHAGKQVALLDRATFPRDKFCGDAWCAPALDIMEEMNVLQKLEAAGLVQDCTSGGFVSPSGESYISAGESDAVKSAARCYAIKRKICDEAIVRAAQDVGAQLFENADCESAQLESDGLWQVRCRDGRVFRSKMLIAADGAASNLSRSLGVVTGAPDGTASRQYVKGGTHNFKSGGVLFYPDYAIPGYVAIFRHYDDDIDIGVYLIEGGATPPENIIDVAINKVANDPFMQRILGPNAVALERPRVASLRTGGVERSTAVQFMAVGDAAGQTDPLTGEGIHTGMIGAKLAALTIHEMHANNDFSAKACDVYHSRWWKAFGKDFPASAIGAKMTYRMPLLLDAANIVAQNKGDDFIEDFGAAMTGVKPKTVFLKPNVAIPITVEIVRQWFVQKVRKPYASIRAAYEARAIADDNRDTAFNNACIRDSAVGAAPVNLHTNTSNEFDNLFRFQFQDNNSRRLYVLYASEYGFASDVAEQLAESLFELGKHADKQALDIRLLSLEHSNLLDWQEMDTCLFLCSTAGDGDPPQAMESFLAQLEQKPDLSHVHFSVLAFGDSAYPNFCAAGIQLEQALLASKANSFSPLVKVNAENQQGVQEWQDAVADILCQPAFWTNQQQKEETLPERAEVYFAELADAPPGSSLSSPVDIEVINRFALSDANQGGRETFFISVASTFDKGKHLNWQPGDALGIFPHNPTQEVEQLFSLAHFDLEKIVNLPRKRGLVEFKQALKQHLDIKKLQAGFWRLLEENLDDQEKIFFEQVKEELTQWELQDVLKRFPLSFKRIDEQQIVDALILLQPRYYSIASAQQYNPDAMDLAVAAMRFDINNSTRLGVASHFLNQQLAVGSTVKAFVQANKHFRIPSDVNKACVMIGAGTGIAPYRAFMQTLEQQTGVRKHVLFFGCRHEHADFLYASEWQNWQQKGLLDVFTAFSRDQNEKIYVQDRLREQGKLVWSRMQAGDHFYICGDATHMAGDVEKALLDIIEKQGNKNNSEAKMYLEQMSKADRYQKDVWV